MVYKHAYLNTLMLLHSKFMLSVVKMPLKREVGIVMEMILLIMESHGKIMELCFFISVGILYVVFSAQDSFRYSSRLVPRE